MSLKRYIKVANLKKRRKEKADRKLTKRYKDAFAKYTTETQKIQEKLEKKRLAKEARAAKRKKKKEETK